MDASGAVQHWYNKKLECLPKLPSQPPKEI